ncbi:MAG: hypothetical protein M1835_004414 [Candelina submexicana]|nr:MAG: hypothetical protein M1835_004414 [Candelina submexicana]
MRVSGTKVERWQAPGYSLPFNALSLRSQGREDSRGPEIIKDGFSTRILNNPSVCEDVSDDQPLSNRASIVASRQSVSTHHSKGSHAFNSGNGSPVSDVEIAQPHPPHSPDPKINAVNPTYTEFKVNIYIIQLEVIDYKGKCGNCSVKQDAQKISWSGTVSNLRTVNIQN